MRQHEWTRLDRPHKPIADRDTIRETLDSFIWYIDETYDFTGVLPEADDTRIVIKCHDKHIAIMIIVDDTKTYHSATGEHVNLVPWITGIFWRAYDNGFYREKKNA